MGQARRLESWKALMDAKSAGKVRSIGVSGVSGWESMKRACRILPASARGLFIMVTSAPMPLDAAPT